MNSVLLALVSSPVVQIGLVDEQVYYGPYLLELSQIP